MAFATINDVNLHLPEDKYKAQDATIKEPGVDADRLIRARLGSVVDISVMDTWTSPSLTPEIVRKISGLLIAAKLYADAVAEDYAELSPFAQELYNRAINELEMLRTGQDVLIDVNGNQIETDIASDLSFYPDDTTEPTFAVGDFWS